MNDGEFRAHTERIEQLLERLGGVADEQSRGISLELLQSVMELHGAAFSRIVEVLNGGGEAGRGLLASLGEDPLLCGLLVLYGVHPASLAERVGRALEKVRPQLRKQGGSVELLSVSETAVRVRIRSAAQGCGSSPEALQSVLERALREAAPEVPEIIAEGAPAADFVPIHQIQPATKEANAYEKPTA